MNTQVNLPAEHLELAEKMSSFAADKNIAVVREIYHDNAEIWHNYDNKNLTVQEVVELVEVIFSSFSELAFKNIRRFALKNGFMQQHEIVGTHINGKSLNVPACVIVTVKADKISRLEEYIDPAPLFAMLSEN